MSEKRTEGNTFSCQEHSADNRTSVTDPNGNATSYSYDNLGRVTQITYPDVGAGQKTRTFSYSCCGLSSVTDENGKVTSYSYDGAGRLYTVTDALSQVIVRFPSNSQAAAAQFRIGECRRLQGRLPEANVEFQKLLNHWPRSPEAYHAQNRLEICDQEIMRANLAQTSSQEP